MANKMIILRNKPYDVSFIVKKVGSPTPLVLDPTDTATIYITEKGVDGQLLIEKDLTQGDIENGEFKLALTAEETATLPFEFGAPEDGEPFLATCRGHISTVTVENGNGEIIIKDIYIHDIGI